MALKFRRVKRRARRNPRSPSLLLTGGLVVGAVLLVRHLLSKIPAKVVAPTKIPQELVEQIDLERGDVKQLEGIGGIFAGGF